MPSDEATQTELTRNAEDRSKPMTLDAMQLAVKEELRRILEVRRGDGNDDNDDYDNEWLV